MNSLGVFHVLLFFALGVLFGACSGTSKEKMLSFFFDEPPSARKSEDPASAYKTKPDSASTQRSFLPPAEYVVHAPYGERECGACHALNVTKSFTGEEAKAKMSGADERSFGSRLLKPREEICFECHDDKSEEALSEEAEIVHGPVAMGECLECHYPHRSRYKSLLKKSNPVKKLCFECHDEEDVLSTGPHADLEGESCTECHNPHAGGQALLE